MCGGHCACAGETGCVLERADFAERGLRTSFSPRPLGETAKKLGIGEPA